MKRLRQYFMAIAAAAIATGSLAVKALETNFTSHWYGVEKINPNLPPDPDNLRITTAIGTPSGDCDPAKIADSCAVYLDLSQFTGSTPENMTLEEATDSINKAQVDPNSGGQNDGFARRE